MSVFSTNTEINWDIGRKSQVLFHPPVFESEKLKWSVGVYASSEFIDACSVALLASLRYVLEADKAI